MGPQLAGSDFRSGSRIPLGQNTISSFRVNNTQDYSLADILAGQCDWVEATTILTAS